jgi:hypothetical protein
MLSIWPRAETRAARAMYIARAAHLTSWETGLAGDTALQEAAADLRSSHLSGLDVAVAANRDRHVDAADRAHSCSGPHPIAGSSQASPGSMLRLPQNGIAGTHEVHWLQSCPAGHPCAGSSHTSPGVMFRSPQRPEIGGRMSGGGRHAWQAAQA